MPQFVEREFREFLLCGVFEAGVARFQCDGCGREHLLPFSCYPQRETICSCQSALDRSLWEYSSLWG